MKVLVIEDSDRLQRYLRRGLEGVGLAVDVASDGREGLWYATAHSYDAIVLDRMLPGLSGDEVLLRLRAEKCPTPVLMLSALGEVNDRVASLLAGADDYLPKPFDFEELVARLRALVRRRYGSASPKLTIGDLVLDTARKEVARRGIPIGLRPREYALFEYLAFRCGQLVSRIEIEAHIYDERAEPMSNVVDAAIYALRKRIDPPEGPSFIRTRRGLGYVLEAPDQIDSR